MDNFKSAQSTYDNAVPAWYNDLWSEMDEGLISEKEYSRKIKLLDQFKSGEINLLELNLKF